MQTADNPLRREWNLADKFVLGYSGNLGRAHEFATVLAAAERLRDEPRVAFLMIGGGKRFEELSAAVQARGLAGAFRFLPYQARTLLSYSLGAADAHWVSLDPRLEGPDGAEQVLWHRRRRQAHHRHRRSERRTWRGWCNATIAVLPSRRAIAKR